MADISAYSCPRCGGPLKLDPETGFLHCEYCDGTFEVSSFEEKVEEKSTQRKKANAKNNKKSKVPTYSTETPEELASIDISQWDAFREAGELEQFDEVVGYTCKNCGAQVVSDKLTVATSCQYCGSSVVVDERVTGGMKPGYVIPFKIKAEELPKRLTEFYANRPLLPKNFFHENQVGEVQGLYVPFWLYDGTVVGSAHFEGSSTTSWTEGDYDVTETKDYESERAGYVQFDNVPVDASVRIDDDLMDSIEPFDYADLKPFKGGYLTGFVAERFDQSPKEVFDRAAKRMEKTARESFESSISYYVSSHTGTYEFSKAAVSYVLLPVYLFNCKYQGKMWRYAVNGQTGKIVGEVPSSAATAFKVFAKGFVKGLGIGVGVLAALAAFVFAFA